MGDPDSAAACRPHAAAWSLEFDPWGRLVLVEADGGRYEGVVPVRAFPITDPRHWISLCDAQGREIASVPSLDDLPPHSRAVLEQALARREFMPVIRRIKRVSGDAEPVEWEVETDRGPTTLMLNSEDDVRRLPPHGALVIDAQSIRYLVRDRRALDAYSRRILEKYL